jgi:uncharacterized membrane protein (DUF441 family)
MIAAIGFGIRYLPLIVGAVQFVQNFVLPDASPEARKALAVTFVVNTLAGLGVTVNDRTREIIGGLVNLTVIVLNAFGIFQSTNGPLPEAEAIVAPASIVIASPAAPHAPEDPRIAELEDLLTRR